MLTRLARPRHPPSRGACSRSPGCCSSSPPLYGVSAPRPPRLAAGSATRTRARAGPTTCCSGASTPATANLVLEVTSPAGRRQRRRPRRGTRGSTGHPHLAVRRPGELLLDACRRAARAPASAATAGPASWWPASPATTRVAPSASPTSADRWPARTTASRSGPAASATPSTRSTTQTKNDLAMAEAIAIPITVDRAHLGVRQPDRRAAAARRRADLDRRHHGDPARPGDAHRRLDLLAEHDHGDGPGAGDRLQPVHRQPLPRGDPQRRARPTTRCGAPCRPPVARCCSRR